MNPRSHAFFLKKKNPECFKSRLDRLERSISMSWFCWYFYNWERCFLRRITAILLKQKNFGPNVIYFALGITEGRPAGPFRQRKLYFEQEKRPAGPFGRIKLSFEPEKSSRRGLLGQIFHKLRIQCRMQIFRRSVLNCVLTLAQEYRGKMVQIPPNIS